jgi:hypothetical protein
VAGLTRLFSSADAESAKRRPASSNTPAVEGRLTACCGQGHETFHDCLACAPQRASGARADSGRVSPPFAPSPVLLTFSSSLTFRKYRETCK